MVLIMGLIEEDADAILGINQHGVILTHKIRFYKWQNLHWWSIVLLKLS